MLEQLPVGEACYEGCCEKRRRPWRWPCCEESWNRQRVSGAGENVRVLRFALIVFEIGLSSLALYLHHLQGQIIGRLSIPEPTLLPLLTSQICAEDPCYAHLPFHPDQPNLDLRARVEVVVIFSRPLRRLDEGILGLGETLSLLAFRTRLLPSRFGFIDRSEEAFNGNNHGQLYV